MHQHLTLWRCPMPSHCQRLHPTHYSLVSHIRSNWSPYADFGSSRHRLSELSAKPESGSKLRIIETSSNTVRAQKRKLHCAAHTAHLLGCTLRKVDTMGRRGNRKASKVTEKLAMPACFLFILRTVPSSLYDWLRSQCGCNTEIVSNPSGPCSRKFSRLETCAWAPGCQSAASLSTESPIW